MRCQFQILIVTLLCRILFLVVLESPRNCCIDADMTQDVIGHLPPENSETWRFLIDERKLLTRLYMYSRNVYEGDLCG